MSYDPASSVPPEEGLPGRETNSTGINWLGSSYSGADIKVLAHLYTELDLEPQINKLREEMSFAQELAAAYQRIRIDASRYVITFQSPQERENQIASIASSGTSQENTSRIISHLRAFIISFSGISKTSLRLNAMQMAAESNYKSYMDISEGIRFRLERLQKRKDDGAYSTLELGTLQTLSVQTFREKEAVRALGFSYPKGICRGPRSIAGSMIFTIFNEHALASLIRNLPSDLSMYGDKDTGLSGFIADQLPPLDITLLFANEYGSISRMSIYGIEFFTDGVTFSIEDLLSEESLQFVARDIDVMTSQGNIPLSKLQGGSSSSPYQDSASNLLLSSRKQYEEYLEKLRLRRSYVGL